MLSANFLASAMSGVGSFKPEQVGVRRIAERARDRLIDPGADAKEPFDGSFAR